MSQLSHKQLQQEKKAHQNQFEKRKKELDLREKKIQETEDKLCQQLREQKKAQRIFEREREELNKQKRKSISKQSASIHPLAAIQANQLKEKYDDLRKTQQLLEKAKSALNRKNQDIRD
eukprot:499953_1